MMELYLKYWEYGSFSDRFQFVWITIGAVLSIPAFLILAADYFEKNEKISFISLFLLFLFCAPFIVVFGPLALLWLIYIFATGGIRNLKKGLLYKIVKIIPFDPDAQYRLGLAYAEGKEYAKDQKEAAKCFLRAAIKGHKSAQFKIGECYDLGHGVPKDMLQAFEWYSNAAEQGDPESQCRVGIFYYDNVLGGNDREDSLPWFYKAAKQDHTLAQFYMGCALGPDSGYLEKQQNSVYWYQLAANKGETSAMFNLAQCYAEGMGVTEDLDSAYFWFCVYYRLCGGMTAEKILRKVEAKLPSSRASEISKIASSWKQGDKPLLG